MTKFICERCTSSPCVMDRDTNCPAWVLRRLAQMGCGPNWREVDPADEPVTSEVGEMFLPNGYTITVTHEDMGGGCRITTDDEPCPGCKEKGEEIERLKMERVSAALRNKRAFEDQVDRVHILQDELASERAKNAGGWNEGSQASQAQVNASLDALFQGIRDTFAKVDAARARRQEAK